MKELITDNYVKMAGKTERGKRDGTGPFEGSAQRSISNKGKRKMRGEKCPFEEVVEKAVEEKEKEKDEDQLPTAKACGLEQ